MELVKRNGALIDHVKDHNDLHLLEYERPRYVRYVDQMVYVGHDVLDKDFNDNHGQIIVFHLAPFESIVAPQVEATPLQEEGEMERMRAEAESDSSGRAVSKMT
jgi:hypothetical protein